MSDDQLRRLLSEAVSDIEPRDRIDELRASVHPSPHVVPMSRPRSWYAATGIVATAAVIGVIAYLTSVVGDKATDLGPATGGGTALPSVIATDTAAPQASQDPSKPRFRPVYYLGHSPRGAVLYRQGTPFATALTPLQAAISGLAARPYDPDYRSAWSPGWLVSAELSDGVIRVELGSAPMSRPARMSARTAYEVVQSAVYTLQAATHSHAKVLFLRSGNVAPMVLGVPTDQPVGPGRASDVLSRMTITEPAVDGRRIPTGRMVVKGTDSQPLGTLVLRLVRTTSSGEKTVRTKVGMSSASSDANGLYRWRVVLDTSTLPPGQYTVVARNDGRGAHGSDTDTRVVVLR
jgi:hypothetical protein